MAGMWADCSATIAGRGAEGFRLRLGQPCRHLLYLPLPLSSPCLCAEASMHADPSRADSRAWWPPDLEMELSSSRHS